MEQNFTYSDKALSNPLMGYAPSARESEVSRDIQLVYMDVTWKELEPQKGVYAWKILEEKNQLKRGGSLYFFLWKRFFAELRG